jgi:hypothetical protein
LQLLDETQKLRLSESHAEIAKVDSVKWEKAAKDAEGKAKILEAALKDAKGVTEQRVRDAMAAMELKMAASEKLLRETREHLQRSVIQEQAATEHAATSQKHAASLQLRIEELLRSDSAPIIASMQQQLVAAAAKQKLHAEAASTAQAECSRVSRELTSSQAALAAAHADLFSNVKLLQEERELVAHLRAQLSAALQRGQDAQAELESEHAAHSAVEHQLRAQKAKIETTNNINRLNLLIRIAGLFLAALLLSAFELMPITAEVSKLEDMLKAVKRVEVVREEVIALLVYNISASEGQDLRSNVDAAEMQKRVRTERMETMRKKVKAEETKMKQAAETFSTTASRLKSKIAELESTLKAAEAEN